MHFVTFWHETYHSVSVMTFVGYFEHDINKSSLLTSPDMFTERRGIVYVSENIWSKKS
jgi:hypothetical protein